MKKTVLIAAVVTATLALTGCASNDRPGQTTEGSSTGYTTSRPAGTTETNAGPTEAPDLISIGEFREGPTTDDGEPTTLVDFEFDQRAYLKGGDRTSFHLVPTDGGDALDAKSTRPEADKAGDEAVTVVFPGQLKPQDYARGYVDGETVTSRKQGANQDNPSNVNQSVTIGGGETENPDLASVTRDGDQVLFEFDQPLTKDDVVQNTGGLRIYFPKTDNSTLRQAGALAVRRKDETTLRAFFGSDLPGNRKLSDTAGAFVKQGTVQAEKGSRGGNDGMSAFDEISKLEDTGTEVCPDPESGGSGVEGRGPTKAPDLMSVGNFRRGPFTGQFTPTTCVDFTFDQEAYLTGSNRTSFHLVPTDGDDALDATDVVPGSDRKGDALITVAFPGKLQPEDFARGHVDGESLSSNAAGDGPTNVGQAAGVGENNRTDHPDLVSIVKEGDQFLFGFDQPLTKEDVVQDTGGLRLYFSDTRQSGATVVEKTADAKMLRATFEQLPEGLSLEDAVGGFVTQGAVQGKERGSANAFDELSPIEKP